MRCLYAECLHYLNVMLSVVVLYAVMPSAVMLNVIMLSVVVLYAVFLSAVMLNDVMLSVVVLYPVMPVLLC
jgi:hypothetical protein